MREFMVKPQSLVLLFPLTDCNCGTSLRSSVLISIILILELPSSLFPEKVTLILLTFPNGSCILGHRSLYMYSKNNRILSLGKRSFRPIPHLLHPQCQLKKQRSKEFGVLKMMQ